MKPITIYMANLTHVDNEGHAATESIPLNIGFLASYVLNNLDKRVHIELFNIPSELEKALEKKRPHILGCSNYSWNSNLNYSFIAHYKAKYPDMVTIMGGPNFPGLKEKQSGFLKKHNAIDFYIYEEGEKTFLDLIRKLADSNFNIETLKSDILSGCKYIYQDSLVDGGPSERLTDLSALPSPYISGLFDKMLMDGFVPMIQTDRGCPFSCAYCHSSLKYYNRIYKFDLNTICKEIDYIGEKVNTKTMHLTNDNFGILNQDLEIARKLSESRAKRDWPLQINLCTAKSRKENVLNCLLSLGDTVFFTASMQTMNEGALQAIKRKNLTFSQQKEILTGLRQNKLKSLCELILGLPEETCESHLTAIKKVLDAGINLIGLYTCMLLRNTPLAEDHFFDKYKMVKKCRVIPRDFGIYLNRTIVEIEEVCVETKDLKFDDYIFLRGFHFTIFNFYNLGVLEELVSYLRNSGVSIYFWLTNIHDCLRSDEGEAGQIYWSFIEDTKDELWDTEEEIIEYYSHRDNFLKLENGEEGANLLQKYSALFLDNLQPFVELAANVTLKKHKDITSTVLTNLSMFCLDKRANVFNDSMPDRQNEYDYDLLKWIEDGMQADIEKFATKTKMTFFQNERQKEILRNYLDFYGDNHDSRGKIITRIQPALLYRNCRY